MAGMCREAMLSKKKKTRTFTDSETELLISEWFKYPCLYDKSHSDYHDKNMRDVAKNQIAEALNTFEYLGVEDDDEEVNPNFITGMY